MREEFHVMKLEAVELCSMYKRADMDGLRANGQPALSLKSILFSRMRDQCSASVSAQSTIVCLRAK